MHVYLVQHGKALAEEQDPQRPLSEEGPAETEKVAQALAARSALLFDPPISEIRHSSKLRARQTAEILADILCPKAVVWVSSVSRCKRLEEGTFRLPAAKSAGKSVELKASELAMLLAGIDLTSIKRRKRFARPA